MLNIINTIKVFGHELDWDLNTTLFWFIVAQTILLILIIILFIILLKKLISSRNNKENKPTEVLDLENHRHLVSISLDTNMVQREFDVGEEFNSDGLIVTANYDEEPLTEIVSDYEVHMPIMNKEGKPLVAVTYKDVVSAYAISVNEVSEDEDTSEGPNDDDEEETPHVTQEVIVEEESVEGGVLHYDRSFTARFIQSDDDIKHWYTEIKNYLLSYMNIKDRISWRRESFKHKNQIIARLAYRGKTLCLFLPLNALDLADTKYKVEDVSDNHQYQETPCMYRIKNEKRVRYAMELIEMVMIDLEIEKIDDFVSIDYFVPYEGIVELINKGLIKREIKNQNDFLNSNREEETLS